MVLHIKTGLKHLREDKLYEAFRKTIEDAFRARGYSIVPGFFESLENKDIAYIVMDIGNKGSVAGTLLALHQESDEAMREHGLESYIEINKIAVLPKRWRNGVLADLMYAAKAIVFGERKNGIPTIWRTSDADISRRYELDSEFGSKPATIDGYFIHGFGFKAVANGEDPRYLFEHSASLIAAKPATIIKTGNSSGIINPLEYRVQTSDAHQHT